MISVTPVVSRTAEAVRRSGVWELGLMAAAYLCYALVREAAAGRVGEATARSMDIIQVERSLGVFHEGQLQAWVIPSDTLIRLFNAFYTYGHFPLIVVVGLWLFLFHRQRYQTIRSAFLISGALSLVVFNLFPVAPPRLMPFPYGMVDTLHEFSAVNYEDAGKFVNNYAAMPSLHVGWNLLLGIAIATTARGLLVRAAGALMPVLMSVTVVVTGNHFFLDIVAGFAVAIVGLALALQVERLGWRLQLLFGESRAVGEQT